MNDRTKWTDERALQLEDLESLIRECVTMNNGSGIIERLQRIEDLSCKLSKADLVAGHNSFMGFLREIAVTERTNARAEMIRETIDRR